VILILVFLSREVHTFNLDKNNGERVDDSRPGKLKKIQDKLFAKTNIRLCFLLFEIAHSIVLNISVESVWMTLSSTSWNELLLAMYPNECRTAGILTSLRRASLPVTTNPLDTNSQCIRPMNTNTLQELLTNDYKLQYLKI